MNYTDEMEQTLIEKIIYINRVAKVVKGGRRFSFSALAVVGDGNGKIGYALGKANEVPEAIRKATEKAKKTMTEIPLENSTIPHEVIGNYGAGKVILKPASPGTGVISGNVVRAMMEAAGVKDILSKNLGTNNPHNVVKATFKAFTDLKNSISLARSRGKYQEPSTYEIVNKQEQA